VCVGGKVKDDHPHPHPPTHTHTPSLPIFMCSFLLQKI
jgi:hypothetical protein